MSEVSTIAEQSIAPSSTKGIKPGVFNGLLKQWQMTAFASLVHAGIDQKVAHKICGDYASDLGRMMASDGKFKSKIGKLDDDGFRNITMTGRAAIKQNDSTALVYVVQTMDVLYKEELLGSRKLPVLSANLQDYLSKCEDWTMDQTWDIPEQKD